MPSTQVLCPVGRETVASVTGRGHLHSRTPARECVAGVVQDCSLLRNGHCALYPHSQHSHHFVPRKDATGKMRRRGNAI